ncbi:MAG: cation diffusion facilitator family transporter [Alphaproteobacteria bacterium]
MSGTHAHHHGHHHGPAVSSADLGTAFKWAVGLNAGFVVAEAAAGFTTGSLALLADAAHNLTDVLGLLIAWGAAIATKRVPTARFTYGLGRSTILAALANAVAILLGVGGVIWEAAHRFSEPVAVPAYTVMIVAGIGIAINAGTAMLFLRDRRNDLNAEGAFLHMAADAAVSLGVVISALILVGTGWTWVDPLTAILVSVAIAWSAYGLLRSSMRLSLDGVPEGVDRTAVETWLRQRPGVRDIHDLHVWALSTTSTALTAHLVMPDGHPGDAFLAELAEELRAHHKVAHATLQIELGNGPDCILAPAGSV